LTLSGQCAIFILDI